MAARTLNKDDLFGRKRVKVVPIPPVDEDDEPGRVWAQSLPFSVADRIIEEAAEGQPDEVDDVRIDVASFLEDILIHGIVDGNGRRIFDEEDRDRLRPDLPFDVAMDMANAVMDVSGLGGQTEESEEEEGNGDEGSEDEG